MAFKSPKDIVATVTEMGRVKSLVPLDRLMALSFLGGAYIALGALLAVGVGGAVPELKSTNPGLQKLVFGAVFPVGLMAVVIAGAELFTGNNALMLPGVLSGRINWSDVWRNWAISFLGNFVGSVFVAYALAYATGLMAKEPWFSSATGIAEAKVAQAFWPLFLKGLGCNWLVCLAVWLAIASEDVTGKILGIWWPIMAFVALGFEHSVANMFFVPLGIFCGAKVTWMQFLQVNLVPVTLGNIVGGGGFVGGLCWYLYGRE